MSRSLYILSIFLMVLIAVLVKQQSNLTNKKLPTQEPREYMRNLKLYHYDTDGNIQDYITGKWWEFIPQHKYSVIQQPRVNIYKKSKYSYKISADSGQILHQKLNGKIDLIKLLSSVFIQQVSSINYNPTEDGFDLSTSYLEFNPNNNIATTKEAVKIHKPGLLITSDGMQANLATNQLDLTKNVVTKYQN